jgi:cytochrome P450
MQSPLLPIPVPPPHPLPLWQAIRVARQNTLAVIPQAAFVDAVFAQPSPFGPRFLVSAPEGVRHVLLDAADNYPKAKFQNRLFEAFLGEGILTSEGETWRRHRRLMAPAFDPRSIETLSPMIAATAWEFVDAWRPGSVLDVSEAMGELTLKIISRAMFSAAGDGLGPVMQRTLRSAEAVLARFGLADFTPGLRELRARRRERKIAVLFTIFDEWIASLIAERRMSPGGGDLLDRLIAARDPETGRGLGDREVRDQFVTIFIAGHETTAVALVWTWCLLAVHPQIEARLHAELDASPDAPPAYARQVIEEAMRLLPPVPRIPLRQAQADDVICGVRIPKGALVCVAPWVVHRHRTLWDDPERFDPDRFAGERPARYAYLPFGAGPRVCIGASLAMTEAVIVLCEIARRYRLKLLNPGEVGMRPRLTLRPMGPIGMELVARGS